MDRIVQDCLACGAIGLSLLGSIFRDDFGAASSVDVFVELYPLERIGLIGMQNMDAEFAEILGRRIDLRTASKLSPLFRDKLVTKAKLLHAAQRRGSVAAGHDLSEAHAQSS